MRSALARFAVFSVLVLANPGFAFSANADEFCDEEIGLKDYSLEADDGALAAAEGSRFRLIYWENNVKNTAPDAVITLDKIQPFHVSTKESNNGMGEHYLSTVTDYAARITVKTSTTELYPPMLGNPATKELSFSTMCSSIVVSPIQK